MKQYIENAQRFDELSGPEKVELFMAFGSIPVFIIGLALLTVADLPLMGAIVIGIAIIDFTVMPRFIRTQMEQKAASEPA